LKQFKPHLPAEWEHRSGVLISWPTKSTDWYDNLADAEATYVELIKLITLNNHVYICCYDSDTRQHVQQCCRAVGIPSERFELFTVPYDDPWTRDYGPISLVRRNETVWLNFKFNAYCGVETDTLAMAQLQKCFPKHGGIPVQCRSLLKQFGSLHCITMQIL